MTIFVLLLLSTLCCPLHAQDFSTGGGFITSGTDNFTDSTRVLISAPWAIFSKSLYVFTTGIPIQPVYIQAPSGLSVWMTIQCKGGAARVTVPNFVANFSMVQTDPTGEWILSPLPRNNSWTVTGLGIKFSQNVSICNDALDTLVYGKGADNDIAGKATMTITLNWNATTTGTNAMVIQTASTIIYIWAPTALTNLSTFQATVAAVCLLGIFSLCCLGCLNSCGVKYIRRYNVLMARLTRDELECEQSRVFNPLWIPCAPSRSGYNHVDSTPNSLILMQRYTEIKRLILCTPTAFCLMDRLIRVKYLKSSNYGRFGLELPCGAASQRPQDSSSDDDWPPVFRKAVARRSQIARLQASQPALARQQPKRPSRARLSSQLMRPTYAQQRSSFYNWQQAQALAQAQAQAQAEAQAQSQAQSQAQAQDQAQVAMYYAQNPMYADATNYPEQTAMYPAYQYGAGEDRGAQSEDGRNYESITVGYAFIHHMFAERVSVRAFPSNAMVCKPEQRQGKETSSKENLRYEDLCGGHSALLESRKGKEPVRPESPLEEVRARGSFEMVHTFCQRISPDSACESSSRCCELEEVTESLEVRPVGLEGYVSESYQAAIPCVEEELKIENRSQGSDRADQGNGTPPSDMNVVLGSCSPTEPGLAQKAMHDMQDYQENQV